MRSHSPKTICYPINVDSGMLKILLQPSSCLRDMTYVENVTLLFIGYFNYECVSWNFVWFQNSYRSKQARLRTSRRGYSCSSCQSKHDTMWMSVWKHTNKEASWWAVIIITTFTTTCRQPIVHGPNTWIKNARYIYEKCNITLRWQFESAVWLPLGKWRLAYF